MSEIVYLNGSLIPRSQARISVLDFGFLYGFGLFETMRSYGGQVFRLNSHLSRLAHSAEILGLPVEVLELKGAVMDTIHANKLSSARIRISISIGEGSIVLDPDTCSNPTVLILTKYYQPYPEQVYQKGFRTVVSSIRRNSQSPLSRLKSANFLESTLAKREAKKAGVEDALFLNDKGLLAEASTSNIFLVANGVLKTPGLESGILPGITREVILELALQLDIDVVEQDVELEELFQTEEAFITNSMIEVMPLIEVNGKAIGSGKPGSVTGKLMVAYEKMVRMGER